MKVYIAGPMSGLPDMNYPAFDKAEGQLLAVGYEVLNPTNVDVEHEKERVRIDNCHYCRLSEPHPWKWYVLRTLAMLAEADALALLPNWQSSRGSRVEVEFASGMEIPIGSVALYIDRYVSIQAGNFDR